MSAYHCHTLLKLHGKFCLKIWSKDSLAGWTRVVGDGEDGWSTVVYALLLDRFGDLLRTIVTTER